MCIRDSLYRDHVGVHRQKQDGLSYVGATVLNGRLTDKQLHSLAALAETHGDGHLRATIGQNIVLVNIPNTKVGDVVKQIVGLGLQVEPTVFYRGAVACTGTEFCKLAIAETKGFAKWLVGEMEERLPEFDQQLRLHVTGCTNSCGQSWIADIGLEGKKIKKDGKMVDAFYFCVGGAEMCIRDRRKIYDKLGVSDRLELALYCLHNKIIQTDADEEQVAKKVIDR